jgi:predicted dehydrogenase
MLSVGIIGCGKIADGHVEQIRATGVAEVAAICDAEPLMAEQLGLRMGIARRYSRAEEMLDSVPLDVVHIATPPASHLSLATLCLEAGKHVFIEKPFALNARDAANIIGLGAAARRRIGVNYLYNYEFPMLELRALLAADAIGSPVTLDTTYGYDLNGDYGIAALRDATHWVHRLPGKLFHNVLDHVLSKVAPFFEEDYEVRALQTRRRPPIGDELVDSIPDELVFIMQSRNLTASGIVSAHARPTTHTLRFCGTKDSVLLDFNARTCIPVPRQTQPSAIGRLFPAFRQGRQFKAAGWRNVGRFRRAEFHYFEPMRRLLKQFYAALESQSADPISAADIMATTRAVERVVAAAQTSWAAGRDPTLQ